MQLLKNKKPKFCSDMLYSVLSQKSHRQHISAFDHLQASPENSLRPHWWHLRLCRSRPYICSAVCAHPTMFILLDVWPSRQTRRSRRVSKLIFSVITPFYVPLPNNMIRRDRAVRQTLGYGALFRNTLRHLWFIMQCILRSHYYPDLGLGVWWNKDLNSAAESWLNYGIKYDGCIIGEVHLS